MIRRAALYRVSIHSKGKNAAPRSFGDIDGAGSNAVDALAGMLTSFSEPSEDGSRLVRSLHAQADGDEVFAVVQYGQTGIAADIVSPAGDIRLRQSPDDEQLVRCGCLFRLPAGETVGALAVEIDDGRGIKGLVEQALAKAFQARFPSLVLAIEPAADPAELRVAVTDDAIETVELVRKEMPDRRTIPDLAKWLPPGAGGRVRLEIGAGSPGAHIRGETVGQALDGDGAALAELSRFAGITFDAVLVGVRLADGTRRVFDLAKQRAGRAAARELTGVELDADGEPTEDSLLAALRPLLEAASETR